MGSRNRVWMLRVFTAAAVCLAWRSEALAATAVYAATRAGSLYRTTDGAKSWQQIPITGVAVGAYVSALAIDPQNPANIYVALTANANPGGKGPASGPPPAKLYRSTDGGQSWTESTLAEGLSPTRLVVDPTSPATIYALSGSLHRSTDSGNTFNLTSVSGGSVIGVYPDPNQAGAVYAIGIDSRRAYVLYKSTDFGATWTALGVMALPNTTVSSARNIAIDPKNSSSIYAATGGSCPAGVTNCGLLHSVDGGKTWQSTSQPGEFYDIAFDAQNGAVYASGYLPVNARQNQSALVMRSMDGGKTWTALNSGLPTFAVKIYVDPNLGSTLYATPETASGLQITTPPGIFVTTNSGAAWTLSPLTASPLQGDVVQGVEITSGSAAAPPPPAPTGTVSRTVSAASLQDGPVAAESIVIASGLRLATDSATANYDRPPFNLAGTTVNVTDSAGVTRPAALFKVSPTQVTYQIPQGTATGTATVTITAGDGLIATVNVEIAAVAPGLYMFNAAGLAKAYALRTSNGNAFIEDVFDIDGTGAVVARPITISNGDQVQLIVYGTGFRAAGGDIGATIGGISASILYAGPQGVQPGLDQFNVLIPPELGTGTAQSVDIVLTAGGQAANKVNITVQ